MGEMADYYREREIADCFERYFPRDITDLKQSTNTRSFIWWVKANGKRIRVSEMTKDHLINSINLIKRKNKWREEWLDALKKELKSRD